MRSLGHCGGEKSSENSPRDSSLHVPLASHGRVGTDWARRSEAGVLPITPTDVHVKTGSGAHVASSHGRVIGIARARRSEAGGVAIDTCVCARKGKIKASAPAESSKSVNEMVLPMKPAHQPSKHREGGLDCA
jgi:hypothetical protein